MSQNCLLMVWGEARHTAEPIPFLYVHNELTTENRKAITFIISSKQNKIPRTQGHKRLTHGRL